MSRSRFRHSAHVFLRLEKHQQFNDQQQKVAFRKHCMDSRGAGVFLRGIDSEVPLYVASYRRAVHVKQGTDTSFLTLSLFLTTYI